MAIPAAIFVCLLFAYPLVVGYIVGSTANITFLDSVYFYLTSIFTIGFGDLTVSLFLETPTLILLNSSQT